jgi:hypothetical protein
MYIIEHVGNTVTANRSSDRLVSELRSGAIPMSSGWAFDQISQISVTQADPARDLILGEEWPRGHLGCSNTY